MKTASCSTCSAPIIWAQTDHGKPMPVDAEPVANGNIELQQPNDPRDPPVAHVVKAGWGTHQSHFSSCPNADQHRKAKR